MQTYDYEFDTTVLGGLPVTVGFDWNSYDNSDIGGSDGCVEDWNIVAINGRECKKTPQWLINRIEAKFEDSDILAECEQYV